MQGSVIRFEVVDEERVGAPIELDVLVADSDAKARVPIQRCNSSTASAVVVATSAELCTTHLMWNYTATVKVRTSIPV